MKLVFSKLIAAMVLTAACLCGEASAQIPVASKLKTIAVSVTGEVQKPGKYTLAIDATVMDAIDVAGGLSRMGSGRIHLIRQGRVENADLKKLRRANSRGPVLQEDDEVNSYALIY